MVTVAGHSLVSGRAGGPVVFLEESVSFWGGVDPQTGRIIEPRHPQTGRCVTGTILVLPHGRGSSSSPSVVAEMIRLGTAPAAVVMAEVDPMIVLGSLVAAEMYGVVLPVALVADHLGLGEAVTAEMQPDGTVEFG